MSGDDHQPRLQDFYQAEVLADGSLSGDTTFTATDDDVLIQNDCTFRLIPGGDENLIFHNFTNLIYSDSYGFDLEKLAENSVNLKFGPDFDLDSLPSEGKVSFIVEVTLTSSAVVTLCHLITWIRWRKFLIAE